MQKTKALKRLQFDRISLETYLGGAGRLGRPMGHRGWPVPTVFPWRPQKIRFWDIRSGGAAPRHGMVIFWQCFFHDFLPNRVLKRRLFKIYFLVRKNGFGSPPSAIFSLKNHAFQLRTCFFAIFAARVLTGRAVVEKRLKRCLKRYPGGPVAAKTPCETYLVRKRQKTAHLDSFVSPAESSRGKERACFSSFLSQN